jgi:anti-sigma B factor antagonist
MPPLDLVIEPVTLRTTVVHIAGELDGSTVQQLADCVASIEPGLATVIFDVRGLTFIDSMGVGIFVALHRELDRSARMLQIRNLRGQPRRILEFADVDTFLQLI